MEPPSAFDCIVWRLLGWRDDLIVAPIRSTPNWVPNYDVVHKAFSSCVRKHIGVETGKADFDCRTQVDSDTLGGDSVVLYVLW